MTKDAELVETVRRDLSHPVSEEESRAARARILRDAAGGVLIVFAWVLYRAFDGGRDLWVLPVVMVVVFATSTARQYRIVRPRPATPVPDDVLAWNLKQFTRCFSCRAIIKVMALVCPKCGASPAARFFLIACLIGAFCVFLFWLSLR